MVSSVSRRTAATERISLTISAPHHSVLCRLSGNPAIVREIEWRLRECLWIACRSIACRYSLVPVRVECARAGHKPRPQPASDSVRAVRRVERQPGGAPARDEPAGGQHGAPPDARDVRRSAVHSSGIRYRADSTCARDHPGSPAAGVAPAGGSTFHRPDPLIASSGMLPYVPGAGAWNAAGFSH